MSNRDDAVLVAAELRWQGVPAVFTPVEPTDAPLPRQLAEAGIAVVRTLHAQTAVFAAEAWAKGTRCPGVALVSGAAGLPDAVTGVANAHANGSPLVVIDDRRAGPVDGVDHLTMVGTISRSALAVGPGDVAAALAWACQAAQRPPRGPVLVEVGGAHRSPLPGPEPEYLEPDKAALELIAELLEQAQRPVLVAGGNVYWSGAGGALRRFAEAASVPVVMNGMGRGILPADHDLALSRTRPSALRRADLVLVAGTPLDFRLGYGRFGSARVVHLCEDATQIATHAEIAAAVAGDLALVFDRLTELSGVNPVARLWSDNLQSEELELRHTETAAVARPASTGAGGDAGNPPPLRATHLYAELRRHLARDAIVIGDGGDFVSYAGRFIDTFTPGCFLDPGPYGCLGIGLGYAIGARLAAPSRQVVVLLGDGAAGFSLMELETLVGLGRPPGTRGCPPGATVLIVGNNDGWGLEKHHMQALYGYDVVADLAPGTRYDEIARSLGGHGELVREPAALGPALVRAFASPVPALVNVALDPADAYQRSTVLA